MPSRLWEVVCKLFHLLCGFGSPVLNNWINNNLIVWNGLLLKCVACLTQISQCQHYSDKIHQTHHWYTWTAIWRSTSHYHFRHNVFPPSFLFSYPPIIIKHNWQVEQKPGGRGREWATLGVHPLSWLLSNNRLEKVPFVSVPHTSSNRLLLSN